MLGNAIIFQFGDTFSHKADGIFQRVVNNTAAVVSDKSNPTLTKYTDPIVSKYRHLPVPALINLTKEEAASKQWKIWSFGGTVERDKSGNGDASDWTWFQMRQKRQEQDANEDWVLKWIGIARVEYIAGKQEVWALRDKDALFGVSSPQQ